MISFLVNRILPPGTDRKDPALRSRAGKRSGLVCIAANLLLFAAKLAAGTLSGSVAITADAMNNLSDASSGVVTLAGFRLAELPADKSHPYGHARFEYLAGLAVAAMMLVIAFELAESSLGKIFHPEPIVFSWWLIGVLALSIGVKLLLSAVTGRLGKAIDSTPLNATSADSRNDAVATGAVLLGTLVSRFFHLQIDGWLGLGVAGFLLWSGIQAAKETISPLLGEAADPALAKEIADVLRAGNKVLGFHDLMVHDYGPGQRFASVHVEMDTREDPLVCHAIIDRMENTVLQKLGVHLVIHYDPVVTDDEELNRMKDQVTRVLQSMDEGISIHDFRLIRGTRSTVLMFDMFLPYALKDREDQIKRQLDTAINLAGNKYRTVITYDFFGLSDSNFREETFPDHTKD